MQEHQEKETEQTETESFTDNPPIVVHDGSCKHYWIEIGIDPEGKHEPKCKNCPMGRYFLDDMEIVDGRITSR
jgi:hypothetical protein